MKKESYKDIKGEQQEEEEGEEEEEEEEEEEYVAQEIMDARRCVVGSACIMRRLTYEFHSLMPYLHSYNCRKMKTIEFLVKWKGYSETTWEKEECLDSLWCKTLICKYFSSLTEKPRFVICEANN